MNDKRAHILAKELKNVAYIYECDITNDIKNLQKDNVKLVGLRYKLKDLKSIERKIITDSLNENITLETAASKISDVIRYTLVIDDDDYVEEVKNSLDLLVSKGYKIIKFKNYWANSFYKGVNVSLEKDDIKFELQFHTNESYYYKQNSHQYYEIKRLDNSFGGMPICNIKIPEEILGYTYKA